MVQVIVTAIIGLGTVATTAYLLRANRRKLEAEEVNILTTAADRVVSLLNTQLDAALTAAAKNASELAEQRRRRHELEERLNETEHRIAKLELWIVANTGHDPATINGQ